MIFENKGKENTLETLHIALNAAKERGTTLVVASSAGDTLIELIKMRKRSGQMCRWSWWGRRTATRSRA